MQWSQLAGGLRVPEEAKKSGESEMIRSRKTPQTE